MKHLNALTLSALLFVALVSDPASQAQAQAQGRRISLPPQASQIAHGIYDLGQALDADGTVVQGFAFIHYKKGFARPEKPGPTKPPTTSPCFDFLASGAKWKSVEPFIVDATAWDGDRRLDSYHLLALLTTAIATWEEATGYETTKKDILGIGYVDEVSAEVATELNNLNEVTFGTFDDPWVIAMTTVWGVWGGPPAKRHLSEWDMVFGDSWGWHFDFVLTEPLTGGTDFLNIATHEIGHAMGLDHPSDTCTEETMYAYAEWGETKKRDLNAGDTLGINTLYP